MNFSQPNIKNPKSAYTSLSVDDLLDGASAFLILPKKLRLRGDSPTRPVAAAAGPAGADADAPLMPPSVTGITSSTSVEVGATALLPGAVPAASASR